MASDKDIKVALTLTAIDRASMIMGKVFSGAQRSAQRLSAMSASLGMLSTQGIIAGGALTAFFGKALKDANEVSKSNRILTASFANLNKEIGGKALENAQNLAEAYQFKIGVNAEEIKNAETRLGIFHNLFTENANQAQIFQRATKAAFDMKALGFGEDAASNAAKLGKLLNDPINNMNAMGKVLGRMNPLQKAHIANLYAQNNLTGAQSYVLSLIEKKFKGAAETSASAADKMKVGFRAISNEIGAKLQPAYKDLINDVNNLIPPILDFIKNHQDLIVIIAKAAVGLLVFSSAMKVVSFGLSSFVSASEIAVKGFTAIRSAVIFMTEAMMANPILAIIIAIAAVALVIYENWGGIGDFFSSLWDKVVEIFSPALEVIKKIIMDFTPIGWIIKLWEPLSGLFSAIWGLVSTIFIDAIKVIGFLLLNFTPVGLIFKYWDNIAGFFTKIWDNVKGPFNKIFEWVMDFGAKFYDAGAHIISSIIDGITSKITAVTDVINNVTQKIRDYFPFSPAKTGPLKTIHKVRLMETIASSMNPKPVINAMNYATGNMSNQINKGFPAFAHHSNSNQTIHYNPVINLHGSATAADAKMISDKMRSDFEKMMREYESRKSRSQF